MSHYPVRDLRERYILLGLQSKPETGWNNWLDNTVVDNQLL